MKKVILMFFLAALFMLLFSQAALAMPDDEGYYFDSMDTTVYANLDNSVDVVKNIRVYYTQEKHGLYWYMVTSWDDTRLKYYDISVEGAPYEVQRDSGYVTLKIGDPDYTITGYQDYVIKYSINPGRDHTTELDSLYMNLQEHEHPCTVLKSTFKIVLPQKIDPDYIDIIVGSTYEESSDNPVVYSYKNDTLVGKTTRPLTSYEGITVKIDLPEGYFSEAKDPYIIQKMLAWIIPLICIILGTMLWFIFGRDPKFIIPVEVSAPDGISPAEAGFIIDGIADNDDAASLLVYWASLGYMNIEERKKNDFTFIKLKDMVDERPAYEKKMFEALFNDDTEVDEKTARTRLGDAVAPLKTALKKKYETKAHRLIDKKSEQVSALVMTLATLCLMAASFYLGLLSDFTNAILFGFFSLLPIILIKSVITTALSYGRRRRKFTNLIIVIIVTLLFIITWVIFYGISINDSYSIPAWNYALMIFGGGYLIILSHYTKKMTDYGHKIFERVLGFRMFMNTAHRDRLETLAEGNPQFFYDRLPYALALGVSRKWISKFTDIITAPPSWYKTDDYAGFNMMYFTHSFTRTALNVSTPIKASSYSSGYRPGGSSFSSGGGFSGGGFGGGGSSSW